jgi:copper(I)-binding protein
MLSRLLIFAALALALAGLARAEDRVGDIRILAAWARATPGPTAAAYLDLRNEGSEADRLVGASSSLAERIEFHAHRMANGVMSMADVPEIVMPPGTTVRLRPGELHLMLFRIGHGLRPGDRFPLTLIFERAGTVTIEAVTAAPGALGPPS